MILLRVVAISVLAASVTPSEGSAQSCPGDTVLRRQQVRWLARTVVNAETRYKSRTGAWADLRGLMRSPDWWKAIALVPPGIAPALVAASGFDAYGSVMPGVQAKFVASDAGYALVLDDGACGYVVVASDDGRLFEGARLPPLN
jgi:hypothetical protein